MSVVTGGVGVGGGRKAFQGTEGLFLGGDRVENLPQEGDRIGIDSACCVLTPDYQPLEYTTHCLL